jgi:hypothetical protein
LPIKKLRARGVRGRPFTEHCAYCYLGCLLAVCGSTMHLAHYVVVFQTIFFLLSVWFPWKTNGPKEFKVDTPSMWRHSWCHKQTDVGRLDPLRWWTCRHRLASLLVPKVGETMYVLLIQQSTSRNMPSEKSYKRKCVFFMPLVRYFGAYNSACIVLGQALRWLC